MKSTKNPIKDTLLSFFILTVSFALSLMIQQFCHTKSLIPIVFVLAVFLISLTTWGYAYGIISSLISVLAVNYAFTFPFFKFNFTIPENLFSAVIMLIVTIITSALTTKIIRQEKVKVESEKEIMRANLLRAVSHDLRTPLTSIYGSCSAIIENYDRLSKEQHLKLLGEMSEDAEWLIQMVENLLSVTRIDGQKINVVKTPTVLEELIDAVVVKFHKRYPKQDIRVEIPDDFISIPMDAMLIQQVIVNILENAVQHAQGMRELSLKVFTAGNHAVFEIADDGCGIPPERLEDLFTGYLETKGASADHKKHNMGIGLSVCATIIKAHGGTICAENRKSGGAVFRFSLDLEDSEDEQ